jgi:hypothetical protein
LYKLPLISGAAFFLLLLISLYILCLSGGSFLDSYLPEIFGFSLDGLILFSGLTMIQIMIANKQELARVEALKGSLQSIAGNYIACCHLVAHQHEVSSEEYNLFSHDSNAIDNLRDRLQSVDISDDTDSVKELVEYVKNNKSILESALPIAAQISPSTAKIWYGFLTHINIISSSSSRFGPAISNSFNHLSMLSNKNV